MKEQINYDLAVIGGGSGGFGTALAAGRRGLRVLLIEQNNILGGTSTIGGVNTWEPGVGGPIFANELYERLSKIPDAIGIGRTVKFWTNDQPWGLSRIDKNLRYKDTKQRAGIESDHWFRATFEPRIMATVMQDMLMETGNVTILLNTRVTDVATNNNKITAVTIANENGVEEITAKLFADASGQIIICKKVGCKTYLGTEPKSIYNEPSAPDEHQNRLNGITISFRITPIENAMIEPLPLGIPDEEYTGSISITEYPNGDLNLNILPLMQGWEYYSLGDKEGRCIAEKRLYQLWQWLQREKGFDRYKILEIFPFTGIREGHRLIGRKVLTENDVRMGSNNVQDKSRWIAIADHALDVHGEGHLCRELNEPYGIPYDCLLPQEYTNLIVPCRGASFSHIAAASCRLSRTMMQLGNASGIAAAIAVKTGNELPDIDVSLVQKEIVGELGR